METDNELFWTTALNGPNIAQPYYYGKCTLLTVCMEILWTTLTYAHAPGTSPPLHSVGMRLMGKMDGCYSYAKFSFMRFDSNIISDSTLHAAMPLHLCDGLGFLCPPVISYLQTLASSP